MRAIVARALLCAVALLGLSGSLQAKRVPLTGVSQIATGSQHSCALMNDQSVRCWGANNYGQLGNGTKTDSAAPVAVAGVSGATQIALGSQHACALLVDGTMKCWGWNASGALGNGSVYLSTSALPVPIAGVIAIAAGSNFTCAVLSGGAVNCWGSNNYGQLGSATVPSTSTPMAVPGLTKVTSLAAGFAHACAHTSARTVLCWGANYYGQLGNGAISNSGSPGLVSGVSTATSIAAGTGHTCARLASGIVKCWGNSNLGQLGVASMGFSATAQTVSGVATATAIATGDDFTCAVLTSANLQCWGSNDSGQLGQGLWSDAPNSTPSTVSGISGVSAVAGGANHACALLATGAVNCWGSDTTGQVGNDIQGYDSTAAAVVSLGSSTAISSGAYHACAVSSAGTVSCWGENTYGALGNGTQVDSGTPVKAAGLSSAVSVSAGGLHTCALRDGGSVYCWGNNSSNQIGDGSFSDRLTPTLVPGLAKVTALAAGADHTCALIAAGTVSCWGGNGYGQLGIGKAGASVSTPQPIPGLSAVKSISSNAQVTCAVLNSGSIKCWGYNGIGILGNGTTKDSATPVLVSGISTATAISVGRDHACALLRDGSAQCWGSNGYNQLGQPGANTSLPVAVSSISGLSAIAAGGSHTCGLSSAGIESCWGAAGIGQLGNGISSGDGYGFAPHPVIGLSATSAISAGINHSCALLVTGAVWCWGNNYNGELGNGDLGYFTLPQSVLTDCASCSSTTLGSSHNPSITDQSVVVTARISGSSPTGTVTFNDSSTALCKNVVLSAATASCTMSALRVGTHAISAVYSGDANNSASTSAPLNQVVTGFVSLLPARLMDTRSGRYTSDGQFLGAGPLLSRTAFNLTVLGRGGVPTSGVDSVVLNVTATNPTTAGFVTVWPTGSALPRASNLNVTPAVTVANLVIGKVGSNGQVSMFTNVGAVDLVADVVGYFTRASDLTSLVPARLLDTRAQQPTTDGLFAGVGAVGSAGMLDLPVLGRGGVASSGISAVFVNVTATNPTLPGYLTVWPSGNARPLASNLNFTPGQTVPNLVVAKLGEGGKISFFNSQGSTDLIADVVGAFASSADLTALSPARVLDTRAGQRTIDQQFAGQGAIAAKASLNLIVLGRGGVPSSGVGAVVLNLTATNPTASSFVTAWPTGQQRPVASNMNFVSNQTVANLVIAQVGADGQISLYNNDGSVDVVADVVGWFPGPL